MRFFESVALACALAVVVVGCASPNDDSAASSGPNGSANDGGILGNDASANDGATSDASDGVPIDSAPWTPLAVVDAGPFGSGDGDGGVEMQGNIGESCKAWMARIHPEAVSFKANFDYVGDATEGERHGRAGHACAYVTYFTAAHDSYMCGYFDSDTPPAATEALFGARPVAFCQLGGAGGTLTNATYFSTAVVSTSEGIPPLEQGWKDATGQSDEGENCRTWLARTGQATPDSSGTVWTRVIVDGIVSQWPFCATFDTTYETTPSIGDICSTGAGPFGEKKYFAIGSCSNPSTSSEGAVTDRTQTK